MKVVNISLDPKILDRDSSAAIRVRGYGETVELYTVIVPTAATMTVKMSDTAVIYGISGTNKIVQLFNIYRKLISLAKEGKCDVIASSDMYFLGLVSLFAARTHHLGLEIQVLGIEKLSPLRKKLAQFVLSRSSIVRALSYRLKRRLVSEFGIKENHINVVPIHIPIDTLGLDVRSLDETQAAKLDELREGFKKEYGSYINFLTVSRLVSIKNIPMQLEALKKVVATHPHVRLHIVGDGPEKGSLKAVCERLGLSNYVVFHGRKTGLELGLFYFECHCFILTSFYEGWGMVIVEAATAGLPIIMTDVGCAGEFVVDGESAIVVPANDVTALTDAMTRVVSDRALRELLSLGTKKALASLETFDEILTQYKSNWELAFANKL